MQLNKTYVDYLGLPFKHLGRDRKGVDCWGLVLLYYKEMFGIEIPDWEYEPEWSKRGGNFFKDKNKGIGERIVRPKVHDVALFFIDKNDRVPNHIGIIIDTIGKTMIQCGKIGVTMACYGSPVWNSRLEGFYRICQS